MSPAAPPPASPAVKVDGFSMPLERFSMGASAGTGVAPTSVFMHSVYGQLEMPLPKSIRVRTDLLSYPPGYVGENGLNLGRPPAMSASEREHHAQLAQLHAANDHLALLHNDRVSMLVERR
jgi:hypothetical protein